MLKTNLFCAALIISVIYITKIEGVNLSALKSAFTIFFNAIERITGKSKKLTTVRSAYNGCSKISKSYDDLIVCADTAFASYKPLLANKIATDYESINVIADELASAVYAATSDLPENNRGIPIGGFVTISNDAYSQQQQVAAY